MAYFTIYLILGAAAPPEGLAPGAGTSPAAQPPRRALTAVLLCPSSGVGKTLTHTLLAKALYRSQPDAEGGPQCHPGRDCPAYKVLLPDPLPPRHRSQPRPAQRPRARHVARGAPQRLSAARAPRRASRALR